jgi:GrpB-like predicted nucleotidyltransferase (UPF0157 family)
METLKQRVARAVCEEIRIVPYDPRWPEFFREEKEHLLAQLPCALVLRIEHFGSTAVPGLASKAVIDMLVEVTDLEATKIRIAPILEGQGYDYFWRPVRGDDGPPFYAFFIKRAPGTGERTHHIHMLDASFREPWEQLRFRDYLIGHPEVAREYERLKVDLAARFRNDRVAYTNSKSDFIAAVMERARHE